MSRSQNGFTLIELLVALVISGIVAGALFQSLVGQGQFARYIGAREEVQQNARVAAELISSELRAAIPGGIRAAGANSIRFFTPRAWGISCTPVLRNNLAQTVGVRFPAGAINGSDFTPGARRWGLAFAKTADPVNAPAPHEWSFTADISAPSGASLCSPGTSLGAAAGADDRTFTATGLLPDTASVGSVPLGALVAVVEQVAYDIGTETAGGPQWVRRSTAFDAANQATMSPMAGPLRATDGLRFRYFDANGNELAPSTLGTQAALNAIASITVSVTTNSTARFNGQAQIDSAVTRVTLRNR